MILNFYEKPGCVNNTKQKNLLKENGHAVIAFSLLSHQWTPETLRPFFGDMPVEDWFNKSAPRIKSGELNPIGFDEKTALCAMFEDALLIRRPLIEADGEFACGFDNELVNRLLGDVDVAHLQSCPKTTIGNNCD